MTGALTLAGFGEWARGTATIRACLSGSGAVYPTEAPDNALRPYIVYHVITDPAVYELAGTSDIRRPLLQVESWGDTLAAATKLADAVRGAASAFRGQLGSLFVRGMFLRDARPGTEDPKDGSSRKKHYVQQDYELFRGS